MALHKKKDSLFIAVFVFCLFFHVMLHMLFVFHLLVHVMLHIFFVLLCFLLFSGFHILCNVFLIRTDFFFVLLNLFCILFYRSILVCGRINGCLRCRRSCRSLVVALCERSCAAHNGTKSCHSNLDFLFLILV